MSSLLASHAFRQTPARVVASFGLFLQLDELTLHHKPRAMPGIGSSKPPCESLTEAYAPNRHLLFWMDWPPFLVVWTPQSYCSPRHTGTRVPSFLLRAPLSLGCSMQVGKYHDSKGDGLKSSTYSQFRNRRHGEHRPISTSLA